MDGDIAAAASLLERGADPNTRVRSQSQAPILLVALGWRTNPNMRILGAAQELALKSKPIIWLLLEAGADFNTPAPDGTTALLLAVCLAWQDVLEYLLDNGADINACNTWTGHTALMLAAQSNDADILQLLLDRGADINRQDRYGNTALMLAARLKHTRIVQTLLERNADIHCKHRNGVDTALSFAQLSQATEIISLLQR